METNFNFNSQVCTDRNQSERLLALGLKKETADCYLFVEKEEVTVVAKSYYKIIEELDGLSFDAEIIPAWSLYRLINMIPKNTIVNIDMVFPFRRTALTALIDNDCDLYEGLVQIIERSVKEGYFYQKYLV